MSEQENNGVAVKSTPQDYRSDKSYFKAKLFIRGIFFAGLMIVFYAISLWTTDTVIFLEIEWISVSTVGTMTIGFGIMISAGIADILVERLYKLYAKTKQ